MMEEILTDLSPVALAAPGKNNLYAYFCLLGSSTASQQAELPQAYRWQTLIPPNVATLPAARGKGLGMALTLVALRDARSAAYHVGVLQSSEMGYGVYRRMGFWQVCMMDYFHWIGQPKPSQR